MTPLERIDYAINRINTVGWTQCTFRKGAKPEAPGCLLGSIITDDEYLDYVSGSDSYPPVAHAIYAHINGSVVGWNDKPGRTVEEVIAVLEAVRPQFVTDAS